MAPNGRGLLDSFARFSPEVADAWRNSHFGGFSPGARQAMADTAIQFDLAGGESVPLTSTATGFPVGTCQPGLVVDGMLRVYVTSQRRQVTTRYAGPGDAFGIPTLIESNDNARIEASAQALIDTRLLLLSPATLTELVSRDLSVAQATITGLQSSLRDNLSLVAENVIWPLRQRLARHLLDLAVREGPDVVVPATVQTIADATGTVREVVFRLLKEMRESRLVERRKGPLVLLDLHALHQIAMGDPDGV
ncbi:Crp/Fnr family transcriptional regulator [Streptomyces iakyrus]|uniref:Crp/Fnr family transcriptional regulator n=1 Tax=Streptomyces iakyrus TaxID=68219 RepID=UPI000525BD40|nr:Crp/Fnr family transcriptional regulator [Streptomyces iakyrus]